MRERNRKRRRQPKAERVGQFSLLLILHFKTFQTCDEESRKQLEFILDQLNATDSTSGESSIASDDETDESIDEDIEIEEEIDQGDPVAARSDELGGKVLLQRVYQVPIVEQPKVAQENLDERPIKPKQRY